MPPEKNFLGSLSQPFPSSFQKSLKLLKLATDYKQVEDNSIWTMSRTCGLRSPTLHVTRISVQLPFPSMLPNLQIKTRNLSDVAAWPISRTQQKLPMTKNSFNWNVITNTLLSSHAKYIWAQYIPVGFGWWFNNDDMHFSMVLVRRAGDLQISICVCVSILTALSF